MKFCYASVVLGLLTVVTVATTDQARANLDESQWLEEGLAISLESSVLEGLLEAKAES